MMFAFPGNNAVEPLGMFNGMLWKDFIANRGELTRCVTARAAQTLHAPAYEYACAAGCLQCVPSYSADPAERNNPQQPEHDISVRCSYESTPERTLPALICSYLIHMLSSLERLLSLNQ
jgi:hypothetical protein